MYIDLKEAERPSKTVLGDLTDEDLFKELHTCCNSNCLTISETARRYKKRKEEIRIYGGHIPPCSGRPCECGFKAVWDSL